MNISIALCTYNGEDYLAEQLTSIAAQTQPVQEVILCDDKSSDDTLAIAHQFHAQGLPLKIHCNPQRLGFIANFSKAISLCTGDIIFLCDQDDIWQENKVTTTITYFQQNPDTLLTFSNASLVTHDATSLNYTLWDALPSFPELQPSFHDLLNNDWVTGAACAFRTSLRERALPIPPDWIHDAWLAVIAAAEGQVSAIPEQLFAYRQHSHNQIGIKPPTLQKKFSKIMHLITTPHTETDTKYFPLQERLPSKHSTQVEIATKIKHLQNRQPASGTCLATIRGILIEILNKRYFYYANGWYSIIRDILLLVWQKLFGKHRPFAAK